MKNQKRVFTSAEILTMILACTIVVLIILLAIAKPVYLLFALPGILVLAFLGYLNLARLQRQVRKVLGTSQLAKDVQSSFLSHLQLPVAVASGDKMLWGNSSFQTNFSVGEALSFSSLTTIISGLDLAACALPQGQAIVLDDMREFTVFGGVMPNNDALHYFVFVEDGVLKKQASEYKATRPSVAYFTVDTYDIMLKELRESERYQLISELAQMIERYVEENNGILRQLSSSRYFAIIEERGLQKMMLDRFSVLDTARKLRSEGNPACLSIGVGHGGAGLQDCDEMALQAEDMAMGRGGDQVAVKSSDGFLFFGGMSKSVESSSKVRSRVMASAIAALVEQNDQVLIMGHRNSDMDALGAGVGMLHFCKALNRPATIVMRPETSASLSLYKHLQAAGMVEDFLQPEAALPLVGEGTLLIIVDTHVPHLLESTAIYEQSPQVVVIDHHRKMVNHIDDATIFHHAPSASSTSEMVTEMVEQSAQNRNTRLKPHEAEALLAGILLDTRSFALHVGVRTFEAAAYLRRMGAHTEKVKALFATPFEDYISRSQLVNQAKINKGFAISVSDSILEDCDVVAAQAANDLLGIEGVQASIVAVPSGDKIQVSARSMGSVNVQLIMEKLGGGGHMTMAGAQLKNVSAKQADVMVREAIESYNMENAQKALPPVQ